MTKVQNQINTCFPILLKRGLFSAYIYFIVQSASCLASFIPFLNFHLILLELNLSSLEPSKRCNFDMNSE